MRWPWVPRALYEAALEDKGAWSDLARDATNRADANDRRFEGLLQKYHALRLAGAVPEPKPAEIVPVPARQEDEAKTLISDICGTDYRKRAMMLKGLASDRAAGRNEQSILREIVSGIQPNGVPA